jgi:hypothetical protein
MLRGIKIFLLFFLILDTASILLFPRSFTPNKSHLRDLKKRTRDSVRNMFIYLHREECLPVNFILLIIRLNFSNLSLISVLIVKSFECVSWISKQHNVHICNTELQSLFHCVPYRAVNSFNYDQRKLLQQTFHQSSEELRKYGVPTVDKMNITTVIDWRYVAW